MKPDPFYARVVHLDSYNGSEGVVYPEYQDITGEWWFWMPGTGTFPQRCLQKINR